MKFKDDPWILYIHVILVLKVSHGSYKIYNQIFSTLAWWHFSLDNSLSTGAVLWIVGYLAASLAFTHEDSNHHSSNNEKWL